jgi:hypothetical protein
MTSVDPLTEFSPGINFNVSFLNLGSSVVSLENLQSNYLRSTGFMHRSVCECGRKRWSLRRPLIRRCEVIKSKLARGGVGKSDQSVGLQPAETQP